MMRSTACSTHSRRRRDATSCVARSRASTRSRRSPRDYDMSFAAVQKHVAVLEAAGLIVKRAEGRERLVRADPDDDRPGPCAARRYEELWRSRIDRLDALLAEHRPGDVRPNPTTDQPTRGD